MLVAALVGNGEPASAVGGVVHRRDGVDGEAGLELSDRAAAGREMPEVAKADVLVGRDGEVLSVAVARIEEVELGVSWNSDGRLACDRSTQRAALGAALTARARPRRVIPMRTDSRRGAFLPTSFPEVST